MVSALGCNSMGLLLELSFVQSGQIDLIRNLLASLNSRKKGVTLTFLRMIRLQCMIRLHAYRLEKLNSGLNFCKAELESAFSGDLLL